MKRTRPFRYSLIGLATAFTLVSAPSAAQVQVGVINSLSGVFSAFGKRYETGMQVALEEINKNGGIKGEPLELVTQDDRSEAQSALSAVESMKNKGVPVVLGSYASSITGPMARLMTREKIPLIVLGSADDSITKPGSDWVFRAKHDSTIVARTYIDYFDYLRTLDSGLKRIALLHGNGAWPTSLADVGSRHAKERGYEIVERQAYDQGTTDFRPVLNRFRQAQPDILFICSYADDGVAITRQLKEVGLNAKAIALDTSSSLPSFIDQVGPLAEQIVSVVSWSKDVRLDGVEDVYKRLKAKAGGEPSFYEAEGYLALRVAADALQRASDPKDREAVRKALEQTDLDTPVSHVKFEDKDGFKNQNPIKSLIVQIQDGHHVTVFPTDLAAAKSRFPTPPWSER